MVLSHWQLSLSADELFPSAHEMKDCVGPLSSKTSGLEAERKYFNQVKEKINWAEK